MNRSLRTLFVNENIGGHRTLHLSLRTSLGAHPEIVPSFLDLPAARLGRRVVSARVPVLGALDADLQPLRAQLALSAVARARLQQWRQPYDVLHVYTQNAALLSAPMLRSRPSIVSTDATSTQGAVLHPYREAAAFTPHRINVARRFEDAVYDAATMIVAQSQWVADCLHADYGIERDRVRVIPFGIVVPPEPVRTEPDVPQITFIGTRLERKGGWRLLELWRRRLRRLATLNLVTLDTVPPEDGLRVFNDFDPGDPRLWALLGETAVLAFPSRVDTFGYVLLEAMAASVPTVSLAITAMPEIVEQGVTGLLVDPAADDDRFADALEELLVDPDRRRAMGAAGRARVLERFDARLTTAALVDCLHEADRRFRHPA